MEPAVQSADVKSTSVPIAVTKKPTKKDILQGAWAAERRFQTDFMPLAVDKKPHCQRYISRSLVIRECLQAALAEERRCQTDIHVNCRRYRTSH